MAKWEILRQGDGPGQLRLVYHNLNTSEIFDCGCLDGQVPDAWVVDWIFNHAEHLTPGDMLQLSNGQTLHYSRTRGQS